MLVLTLKQPWAWAVFHAGKDVENRSRGTGHRGELHIHAGRGVDPDGLAVLAEMGHTVPPVLPAGVIVGSVHLDDVVWAHPSPWAVSGQWHWVLSRPRLLREPIPHRGLQGLHRRR